MKNKKVTFLLIGMLALIWGAVLRRVITLTGPESVPESPLFRVEEPTADTAGYTLRLDYRDPFLEESASRPAPVHPANPVFLLVTLEEPVVPPVDLRFKGVIRQGGALYAIVERAGQTEILRAGEQIGTLTLERITADSILMINGSHKWILQIQ